MPKGVPEELEGVDYLPEPEDPRILSAVDPNIEGWQEAFRAKVTGWEPLEPPISHAPRNVRQRAIGIWLAIVLVLMMWLLYQNQAPLADLTYSNSEWAWEQSGIRELQSTGLNGSGVHVCIVDTGVDLTHPDLVGKNLEFRDFINGGSDPVDYGIENHGTMMVGILVGDGHIGGAAPGVELSVAAALGDGGGGENTGDESKVAAAIDWCWDTQQVDIISLSLGGAQDEPGQGLTNDAVQRALTAGVYVVAAAGNDGGSSDDGLVAAPSNEPLAISVGATEKGGAIWQGSSIGSQFHAEDARQHPNLKPEILAPGVEIISSGPNHAYYRSTGTSDATVFVSGALALILSAHPVLKSSQTTGTECIELVKMALMNSADALPTQAAPHDDQSGYGELDAMKWEIEVSSSLPC